MHSGKFEDPVHFDWLHTEMEVIEWFELTELGKEALSELDSA